MFHFTDNKEIVYNCELHKGGQMKDKIVIGRITGAHGIKGEIEVLPITDDENRFFDLEYFIVRNKEYTVSNVRFHKEHALIKSPEITDRTTAEHLKGNFIEVRREDAVKLEEGQYFIEDMKGMEVTDTSGTYTGVKVIDVLQTGAVDILEFEYDFGKLMIPFLNALVTEVDVESGHMTADLSEAVQE